MGDGFQTNVSVDTGSKFYDPTKKGMKQAQGQVQSLSTKDMKVETGQSRVQWDRNTLSAGLPTSSDEFISSSLLTSAQVEIPTAPKPVTKTTNPRALAHLREYTDNLVAADDNAHNLLSNMLLKMKAGVAATLAAANGATADDFMAANNERTSIGRKKLDSAVWNVCSSIVQGEVFGA